MAAANKRKGKPIPEKPEDVFWRKEFDKITLKEHDSKLAQLGLGDEDIEEFNKKFGHKKKK